MNTTIDEAPRLPSGAEQLLAPDTRNTHGPRWLETLADREREALGRDLEHADSCHSMWASVLELALRDFKYLRDREDSDSLSPHERSKVARIMEHDPKEFLADDWFDEVCRYVGLSADSLRDRLAADAVMSFRHHRPRPSN
ncbi:MAG: hypothetical protein PVJ49_06360 [Acidobacteriota bacterium]